MLILTRRRGESLKIGPDVEIKIMGINGGQVKIGIDAPEDVHIIRTEIEDRWPDGIPPHKRDDSDR